MSVVYLETSAVLQWLLGQPGEAAVRRCVDRAATVVTSKLTELEAQRALIRAEKQGALKEGDGRRIRGLLSRAQRAWVRMAISEAVLARAARSFPVEPVRTLDALHLATALEFAGVYPDLRIVSSDRRVLDNAEALGIAM